jgi:hypothetical protein
MAVMAVMDQPFVSIIVRYRSVIIIAAGEWRFIHLPR